MAEYLTLPYGKILQSDRLDLARLVITEPLTIGFHAVDRAEVADHDSVLIIGCGMIGMGAIIRSALRGATVVVSDIDGGKLETAKAFGASYTVNPLEEDIGERIGEITSGNGADVVIEAVGSPLTYRAAVEQVAFAGRVVCIGYSVEDASLPTKLCVQKEMHLLGSRNATQLDFKAVMAYLESTSGPAEDLISKVVPLAKAGEALKNWSEDPAGITKVVVDLT